MTEDNKRLFEILRASLWEDRPQNEKIAENIRDELRAQTVEGLTALTYPSGSLKYVQAARFVQMAAAQAETVALLQGRHIPVAVIKGTASGIYYPTPYLRTYGDIDLLVLPEHYQAAIALMRDQGYIQQGDIGSSHTALWKNETLFELHQNPAGMEDVHEGAYMLRFMLEGFRDIQAGVIEMSKCTFPMLPWQQNGLELIWHFRVHLYNGIGLRHVIDWMMFVHRCLDDSAFKEYKAVLQKSGLLVLAKTVTRMCQIYLGLEESITWCADVPESLCADLMEFILDQGNFGHKRTDDKAAKVLSRYRTPLVFLKQMQQKGLTNWAAAKKHAVLRPFAWAYVGAQGLKYVLTPGGRAQLAANQAENRQRRAMFDQLYGNRLTSAEISPPHVSVSPLAAKKEKPLKQTLKNRLRVAYEAVRRSPLRAPLYHLQNAYFACRYPLFGKPHISDEDRANVERNVTFIYKSFNRQKLAEKCYRCIKAYYPKARVVIADDSREPLRIANLVPGDLILHLPFNSGLSKGLIAALEHVTTPFTMRMDDDLLLTPHTVVHEQLAFLNKHPEVDLAAVQMRHRHPEKSAIRFSRICMSKQLLIPAGTMIDGREVVYKAPNVFLIRTDSLRKVGYDPNIRMIDHHEFFFRASGQIVCVQDAHAYVMHCHNYFETRAYSDYRADYSRDAEYIRKKHGTEYR